MNVERFNESKGLYLGAKLYGKYQTKDSQNIKILNPKLLIWNATGNEQIVRHLWH